MSSTLQIVDDDLSTVLLDLNSTNTGYGDVTWELLSDVDWASAAYDNRRLSYPNADGGTTTRATARLTAVTFRVIPTATTYDNLAEGLNRLATLLARGGTLKWTPHGSSNTRYRDFEPSDTPVLFEGKEMGIYRATTLFTKPDGVELRITAQPFFYGALLDSDDNLLANATLLRDEPADDTPDGWTLDSGTWTRNTDTEAAQVSFTGTGVNSLLRQDVSGAEGTTYTFSCDIRRVSGTATAGLRLRSLTSTTSVSSSAVSSSSFTRVSVTHSIQTGDTSMRAGLMQLAGTSGASVFEFRNAQLEVGSSATPFHVGTETIDSDTEASLGRIVMVYNPGSAPAPVRVKAQPVAGTGYISAYRVAVLPNEGVVGGNGVVTYATNRYNVQAETMDAGMDTALYVGGSDYSGSGQNTMRTTFTTNTLGSARVSKTVSVNVAALAGKSWRLWVRAGLPNLTIPAGTTNYTLRPFVGGVTFDDVDVTLTEAVGFEIPLGTFAVEHDALDIVVGCYAKRNSGTAPLLWDCFYFEPIGYGVSTASQARGSFFSPSGSLNVALLTDPELPGGRATTGFGGQVVVGQRIAISGPVPVTVPPGLSALYVVGTRDKSAAGASHDTSPIGSHYIGFEFYPRYHA